MSEKKYDSIKNWAEDDKPREKLIKHGKNVLSDAELIGILLATGSKERSAIDTARDLLKLVNGNLNSLGRLTIKEMCKVHGIGPAKAITIISALELGNRRESTTAEGKYTIDGSEKVYQLMKGKLQDLQFEQFWLLTLTTKNEVISQHRISDGGVSGTLADPKRIFSLALDDLASHVILLHNHPSGNLSPSQSDLRLTTKLINAGKILDITVLDHVIIAHTGYYSFADENKME
jgi:DNA repair protein RadC